MELKIGDFVTIVCDIPHGLSDMDPHVPHVKGNLGIITRVCEYISCDGLPCFEVKDEKGNLFVYAKNELIPAFEKDIRRALRELLDK